MKTMTILLLILLLSINKKYLAQNILPTEKKSTITNKFDELRNIKLFPKKLRKKSNLMSKDLLNYFLSSNDEGMIDSIVTLWGASKYKTINTYNQNKQKIESIIKYWSNETWKNYYRYIYEYDSFGNTTLELAEYLNSGVWIPDYKFEMSFNNNNRYLFFKYSYWENGWKNYTSEKYEYSPNGNLTYVERIIDTSYAVREYNKYDSLNRLIENIEHISYDNQPPEISKGTYEYNTEQYLKISTSYIWEKEDWTNNYRYLKSHKENNIQKELFEKWNDSTWSFSSQETWTYDDKNQLIDNLWEDWDGSAWINNYSRTYEYDTAGNILSRVSKNWLENNWVTERSSQETYNINGMLATSTIINISSYDNSTSKYKSEYEYDSNEREVYYKNSRWENDILIAVVTNINSYDFEGRVFFERYSEWYGNDENMWKTYTYYADYSEKIIRDDQINIDKYSLLQNYPNPFNPKTTISFVLPQSSIVRIDLYSILGERVSTISEKWFPEGYNIVRFNSSGLSSGTYIYRLESEGIAISKKMIILK